MKRNVTTEWRQVLTQTGVLLVYLQRDVVSAGQTLTHGGEGHLLDVPDALVDAVDGLVTLPLPRGLVPMTTEETRLLQGCCGVFFGIIELGVSTQSGYCTLQYHKTGESAQTWVFLLAHAHTEGWLSSSSDWLIWEDSMWRAARWAASRAAVPATAESVTVEKAQSLQSCTCQCFIFCV